MRRIILFFLLVILSVQTLAQDDDLPGAVMTLNGIDPGIEYVVANGLVTPLDQRVTADVVYTLEAAYVDRARTLVWLRIESAVSRGELRGIDQWTFILDDPGYPDDPDSARQVTPREVTMTRDYLGISALLTFDSLPYLDDIRRLPRQAGDPPYTLVIASGDDNQVEMYFSVEEPLSDTENWDLYSESEEITLRVYTAARAQSMTQAQLCFPRDLAGFPVGAMRQGALELPFVVVDELFDRRIGWMCWIVAAPLPLDIGERVKLMVSALIERSGARIEGAWEFEFGLISGPG